MAIIKKKTWPKEFAEMVSGKKKYELRLDDFEVIEGDTLLLEEWDPKKETYTGRSLEKKVTYVGKLDPRNIPYWPQEDVDKHGLQIISLE